MDDSPLRIVENEEGEFTPLTYTDLVPTTSEYAGTSLEPGNVYPELLGLVEAQIEFCDQLLIRIAEARRRLAEKKATLEKKAEQERLSGAASRSRVPVIQYMPPYFKDESMMCPPQNEEARHKLQYTTFDPLIREDRKWSTQELRILREAVKESVVHAGVQKFIDRKDVLRSKIQRAGVETAPEDMQAWKEEYEALNRKIQHYRNGIGDSQQSDLIDYSCVDWMKISTIEFRGSRSAASLRYKWLNEQCPRWNSDDWTKEELQKLKDYREDPSFTSWAALAKKLETRRSPYMCFERYRSDLYKRSKDWTKEEDDRLIALVKVMTVNGNVQWDKVTFYMPGRHRQQVRARYQHTLDENVRHGRWTDHEDLLLMSAVARFGAKDWGKVAKAVYGRSDGQCRERWCNVLDKCTEAGDWTAEEDERLVLGIQIFGRGKWCKIAEMLPRHTPDTIRDRYQQLLTAKMRMCTARLCGRTVHYQMSKSSSAVARAKRDILRQQLTNDSLKAEFYRAAKEQARRFPGRGVNYNREDLTPEEKAIVERGVQEIAQKFRNGQKTSRSEVIRKIDLSEREVASIIKAAKKQSQGSKTRQFQRVFGGVKRIRKNMHLLPDTMWEKTEFNGEEPEEERIMCLTEALCQAIRKYDQHEWGNKFFLNHDRPEGVVSSYVTNMLNDKCDEVVLSLRECNNAPADATLPTTFTSASAYRVFQRVRPSLTARGAKYFCPNDFGVADLVLMPDADLIRTYTVHDRLNIQLHPNILIDPDYLKLKAQVRCILFEPTLLAMAIEPPNVEEQRIRTQMELTRMQLEEEHYLADSVVMDDAIVGEIEVATDDFEPLYYEDATDDALNATIHSGEKTSVFAGMNNGFLASKNSFTRIVVDKVCNPSAYKKRGRPRNDDVLAAWEKYVNRSKKRRNHLPRSAKKQYEFKVQDVYSDDDMSLDLPEESETEPSQSSQVTSTSAQFEAASKITLRECIAHNQAASDDEIVQDIVFSLVDQTCSREKRRRGRPLKNRNMVTMQDSSEEVMNGTQCSTNSVETTAKPSLVFAEAAEIERHIFEVQKRHEAEEKPKRKRGRPRKSVEIPQELKPSSQEPSVSKRSRRS